MIIIELHDDDEIAVEARNKEIILTVEADNLSGNCASVSLSIKQAQALVVALVKEIEKAEKDKHK